MQQGQHTNADAMHVVREKFAFLPASLSAFLAVGTSLLLYMLPPKIHQLRHSIDCTNIFDSCNIFDQSNVDKIALQEKLDSLRRRRRYDARRTGWVFPEEVQRLLAQVNDVRRFLIRDPDKYAGGCRSTN